MSKKIQIITLLSDTSFQEKLSRELEEKFMCNVIKLKNSFDALSLLEIITNIEFIICDVSLDGEEVAEAICTNMIFNKEKFERQVSVVVLGSIKSSYRKLFEFEEDVNVSILVEFIQKNFSQHKQFGDPC